MVRAIFISGFIIAVVCGYIIKRLDTNRITAFFIIYVALFLNSFTQMLEAIFFALGIVSWNSAPAIFGQQFLMYIFVGIGIVLLFKPKQIIEYKEYGRKIKALEYLMRTVAASLSYLVYYYIFGYINASLFTIDFYRNNINGLRLLGIKEILLLEPLRGLIMVLSILPLIINMRVSRRAKMVTAGMVLFIIGGLIPMIQQFGTLPTLLVITSTVEIFCQNFMLGVTTVYLLTFEPRDSNSRKGEENDRKA